MLLTLTSLGVFCHFYTKHIVGRETARLHQEQTYQIEMGQVEGLSQPPLDPSWGAIDITFKLVVPGLLIASGIAIALKPTGQSKVPR